MRLSPLKDEHHHQQSDLSLRCSWSPTKGGQRRSGSSVTRYDGLHAIRSGRHRFTIGQLRSGLCRFQSAARHNCNTRNRKPQADVHLRQCFGTRALGIGRAIGEEKIPHGCIGANKSNMVYDDEVQSHAVDNTHSEYRLRKPPHTQLTNGTCADTD